MKLHWTTNVKILHHIINIISRVLSYDCVCVHYVYFLSVKVKMKLIITADFTVTSFEYTVSSAYHSSFHSDVLGKKIILKFSIHFLFLHRK